MTRAERYAEVKALRDRGLIYREITEITGLAHSTIGDLLTDPSGDKARERKQKRYGRCVGCGVKTFNSGSEPPKRCHNCAVAHNSELHVREHLSQKLTGRKQWADEHVLSLMRALAVNGRLTKPRWEAAHAAAPETYPSFSLIIWRWDTWGQACAAADVKPRCAPGSYRNRLPKSDCLAWVQRCADETGSVPSHLFYQEWHLTREGSPSAQTVRNRWGTWMAACRLVSVPEVLAA